MTDKQYSRHQKGIIKRYYEHFDNIQLTRLSELVTELYIAKDTPGEDKLWNRVEDILRKLKVPSQQADHIMRSRRVELLAQCLSEWLGKS
ncbi:MAG: hypothetical protein JW709_12740 [Sedimentisphaerales bacterium]|nr:hypothetical protein [Sedimentisphaerales bacterium]